MLSKAMMPQKTNNEYPTLRKPKKPIIRVYALKSDDDPKPRLKLKPRKTKKNQCPDLCLKKR